jgi:hypothetical protein
MNLIFNGPNLKKDELIENLHTCIINSGFLNKESKSYLENAKILIEGDDIDSALLSIQKTRV